MTVSLDLVLVIKLLSCIGFYKVATVGYQILLVTGNLFKDLQSPSFFMEI